MTDYRKLAYTIPIVNDYKPLIETVITTINSFATSTDLAATALDVAAPLLKLIDVPVIAIGEKAREAIESVVNDYENIEFFVYHFYPSATYNIFNYTTFLDILEDTLTNEEEFVTLTSSAIVWTVSADNQEELVTQVNALRTLFGQPIFKTPPTTVARNKYKDYRKKIDKVTSTKLLPTVKSLTGAMGQAKGLMRDAVGFKGLVDGMIGTLKKKAALLQSVAEKLQAALDALDLLEAVEIDRVVLTGLTNNLSIVEKLREVESAPAPTDLVASSIFIYDSSVATFIEGLL